MAFAEKLHSASCGEGESVGLGEGFIQEEAMTPHLHDGEARVETEVQRSQRAKWRRHETE